MCFVRVCDYNIYIFHLVNMKFKSYTGITWSVVELTGLVEDEDCYVYLEKFKKHLGLHPFQLTNLNAALNEILSSNLNFYDSDLNGFLLAYTNPKLMTPLGEVMNDTCFIHVDIEADFYVFRPKTGCMLKGIVNKKGLDHIGILVHKAFNVSIPKPDNEENWPGDGVEIGQEVRFEITLLDFSSKLPFIRGVLNPDDYLRGCKLLLRSVNNRRSTENNIQDNGETPVNRIMKKNAKNAEKHTFFDSENSEDESEVKKEIVQQKTVKRKLEEEEPVKELLQKKKKIKTQNSQSSVDEDNNERDVKHTPNKTLGKLSDLESKHNFRKIKTERLASDIEQAEESAVENKPKIKKNLYDSDASAADFSIKKHVRSSKSNKVLINIKKEELSDASIYELNDDVSKSPKKRHKKHKHSLPLDNYESEKYKQILQKNINDSSMKENSRKSSKDFEIVYKNIKIKKEEVTNGSENTQNEDHVELNGAVKRQPDLDTSIDEDNESKTMKRKSKKHSKRSFIDTSNIKVEDRFDDVIIKIERPDTIEIFSDQDTKSVLQSGPPTKKHPTDLNSSISDNETEALKKKQRIKRNKA